MPSLFKAIFSLDAPKEAEGAPTDNIVGIRRADLGNVYEFAEKYGISKEEALAEFQSAGFRSSQMDRLNLYVAELSPHGQVAPHFHPRSDELYLFLQTGGLMRLGARFSKDGKEFAKFEKRWKTKAGQTLVVKAGQAHTFQNPNPNQLYVSFVCDPIHFIGTENRIVLKEEGE